MKWISSFIIFIFASFILTTPVAANCKKDKEPSVVNPMHDWDIIAKNTVNIDLAPIFNGNNLVFSYIAHPTNKKNKIRINKKTGMITIKAEKKDGFDIIATATNSCSVASYTFNVHITEEE